MVVFLKINRKKIKKSFNFFKYFLTAKNFLKNRYKVKKHFCFLKKVRSNSFLTVTNGFGKVIISITSGKLNLVTKKYKILSCYKIILINIGKEIENIFNMIYSIFYWSIIFLRHFF